MMRAYALSTLADSDGAIEAAEQAERLYREDELREGIASALNAQGSFHRLASRLDKALTLCKQALALFEEVGDGARAAATHNNICATYENIGDLQQALLHGQQALAYFRANGPIAHTAIIAVNMAEIHYQFDRFDEFERFVREAIALSNEAGYTSGEMTAKLNLSSYLREQKKFDEAGRLIEDAIDYYRTIGDRRLEGICLTRMGALVFEQGEYGASRERFEEGLAIFRELSTDRETGEALLRLGEVAQIEGKHAEAIALFAEALAIDEKIGDANSAVKTRRLLADAHAAVGDYRTAYEERCRHYTAYEVVKGEEQQRVLEEMNARFAVEQAEERAEEQRTLAAERSQQLSSAVALLLRKNSLLHSFRDTIEPLLETKDPAEQLDQLHALADKIVAGMRSDDDWERFAETYRMAHPDFLRRLGERAPDLSPTERKVCALLHVGLSNKQIADLLYVSLRTVESHRYNIRKKLGLSGRSDLGQQLETMVNGTAPDDFDD